MNAKVSIYIEVIPLVHCVCAAEPSRLFISYVLFHFHLMSEFSCEAFSLQPLCVPPCTPLKTKMKRMQCMVANRKEHKVCTDE